MSRGCAGRSDGTSDCIGILVAVRVASMTRAEPRAFDGRNARLLTCMVAVCVAFALPALHTWAADAGRATPGEQRHPDYLHAANQPYALTDRYCCAYTAWHALRLFHTEGKPINQIIQEMGCEERKGSDLASLVSYLKENGIPAKAMRLDEKAVGRLDAPFIPWIVSSGGEGIGHVLLSVPKGNGQCVVLDGQHEPWVVQLKDIQKARRDAPWDGTCIVLSDGLNPATLSVVGLVGVSAVVALYLGGKFLVARKGGGDGQTPIAPGGV